MARVAVLSNAAILDTSWLLELYKVPGYFKESRTPFVREETDRLLKAGWELFVTAPVLFEVASHINHVRDGGRRHTLGERLQRDIEHSVQRGNPWTIASFRPQILLRSQDILRLAARFLESTGPNYSFADISIIDLAEELRRAPRSRAVQILAFDQQLIAYSDSENA